MPRPKWLSVLWSRCTRLVQRMRRAWGRLGFSASRPLGAAGEQLAADYLRRQGFQILAHGYRTRHGEIDLIARDGDTIVFIEVKTRRGSATGHPADAVHPGKQAQLTRLALMFLKKHRLLDAPARFDVVAILWSQPAAPPEIAHYRNAFPPVGRGQMYS